MSCSRVFAVIPAAGRSRRMGQPKLLLPFSGRTVIAGVLDALNDAGVTARAVVVRPDDQPLQDEVLRCKGELVVPDREPPDMRSSLETGLQWIAARFQPLPDDAWLLLPADHPIVSGRLIAAVIDAWRAGKPEWLVPTHAGQRGHPLISRWSTIEEVFALPQDQGLNALLRLSTTNVTEFPLDDPAILCDLDVPADYARLLNHCEYALP